MPLVSLVVALATARAACEPELLEPVHVPDLGEVVVTGYDLRGAVREGQVYVVDLGLRARSLDGGRYANVVATVVDPPVPGAVVDGAASFGLVPASGVATSDDTLQVRVPVARARDFARWLDTTGFDFGLSGDEIPQLQPWVRLVDEPTDLAWDHESWDGIHVHWFDARTALLASLAPGDLLLQQPPPSAGWVGYPWHETVNFPNDDTCGDFPLVVDDVILGDGTNGGDVGQIGVVVAAETAGFQDLYASYRVSEHRGLTSDGSWNGPMDGYQSVAIENAQAPQWCLDEDGDGAPDRYGTCFPKFCPSGMPEVDGDDDPTTAPTDCMELYQQTPFTFSPAPGVEVWGSTTLSSWTVDVDAKVRLGEPVTADLVVTMRMDTTLGLRAEPAVSLARTEVPLFGLPPLQIEVPTGVPGADVELELAPYLGFEGNASARTQLGTVRRDTWTLTTHWDATNGADSDGDHEVTTWPATAPELRETARAHAEVVVGADLSVGIGIAEGLLAFDATLGAEAGLAVDVEASASPWWRTSTVGRVDVTGHVTGLGGLIDESTPPLSLPVTDETLQSAPANETPGPTGTTSRWMRTIDLDPALGSGTAGQRLAVHPAGGFVVTGTGWLHAYVARLDALGQPLWTKQLPFLYGAASVAPLSDGSVVLASKTCGWLARLDADGNLLWQENLAFANNTFGGAACALVPWVRPSDGVEGVVVAGTVSEGLWLEYPAWGFVEPTGTVAWWRRLDTHGRLLGGAALADGGLALVGETQVDCHTLTNAEGYDACTGGGLVLKVDGDGLPVWGASVEGSRFVDVAEAPDGRLLAVGAMSTYYWQPRHGLWVAGLTPDGAVEWSSTYAQDVVWEGLPDAPVGGDPGDTQWDEGTAIEIVDDEVYVTGTTNTGSNRGSWAYRLTTDGVPVWQRLWDGADDDGVAALVHDGDALALAGWTNAIGGRTLAWVGRVPYDGGAELVSTLGFDQRYTMTDVNDAQDLTHVFWFLGGATTFTPAAVDQAVTPGAGWVVPATTAAVSVDRSW